MRPSAGLAAGGEGTRFARESIRYPGGKNAAGTWQWILSRQPTTAGYVEPFLGSGALLRRRPPSLWTVGVDRDPAVVAWWRQLAWPGLELVAGCGIRWLARHAGELGPDVLVYCDPPYMLGTRTKRELACLVQVSGYSAPLYERELAGWHRAELPVITRGGTWRTEVLWQNYDPALAAAGDLGRGVTPGRNFRERERIGRKVRRWRANFARLADGERAAILRALLAAEGEARGRVD